MLSKVKENYLWIFLSFLMLALTPLPSALDKLTKINDTNKDTITLKKELADKNYK